MIGEIIYNKKIRPEINVYDMMIKSPEAVKVFQPGQFIMIKCGDDTTLRRPISICLAENDAIRICYDVRGKGTDWMSSLKTGDNLDFLPPKGNGFNYKKDGHALLAGGGIGIYPLLPIGLKYKEKSKALFGFRSENYVNFTNEFISRGIDVSYITDDGSSGRKGFVTDLLREELQTGNYDIVHVCGPFKMMERCTAIAKEFGVSCEVSMEERMGCGVGACYACVCKNLLRENADLNKQNIENKINGETEFQYLRVCVDGPVFRAEDIVWE